MNLPLGYRYATLYAGIRKVEKDDVALIVSGAPASAAAVFTRNRVQAAPVRLSRKHLAASRGKVGALIVNAGNANCATRTGDRVALECCRAVAKQLRLPVTQVLPASTGVIGVEMDSAKITGNAARLAASLSPDGFDAVARAIMTTDLVAKVAAADVAAGRGVVRVAGMAKGSGMIHPQMATTLAFVLTDAAIPAGALRGMLSRAVESSFNRLSVDGDTSTNDTLVLLANGASGISPKGRDLAAFEEATTKVLQNLAQQIARDGEGARKLVTLDVSGAKNGAAAAAIARAIANSPLVKTAFAGADPNWGRILSAAGNSGAVFDPAKVDIRMQGVPVCKSGLAADFDEEELKQKLGAADVHVVFHIRGKGKGEARFWTCDLTEGYIQINASYRT
jgi:glutamate N-acetyltransferase / amino-acid N-acetyltransferase